MDGLTDKTNVLLFAEKECADAERNTLQHANVEHSRLNLHKHLKDVGDSGNIDLILANELLILQNEQTHYTNSEAMAGSLTAAVAEVKQCQYMLGVVRDPERYHEIDRSLSLGKSRKAGLPVDDARKAYRGHAARLTNLDKSRLTDGQKKIITIRHKNFGIAEKIYIGLQQQALGVISPIKPIRAKPAGLER